MDDLLEFIIKAVGFLIFAPFWILWKIISFLFRAGAEKANQKIAQAQTSQTFSDSAASAALRSERQRQLKALQEAMPPGPPERMRAVFAVNQGDVQQYGQKKVGLIGEPSFARVSTGLKTEYFADMILQLTEAERAIVRQHKIDDIVLEDVSAFSERDLIRERAERAEEIEAAKDPFMKEVLRSGRDMSLERMQSERLKTRVGDLLVAHYVRRFDTYHDAQDHIEKLQTKYIPRIRELIERYRDYKPTQAMEF